MIINRNIDTKCIRHTSKINKQLFDLEYLLTDYWLNGNNRYVCHGRIRLRMRIVKAALSSFLGTSKVRDFLKKYISYV